MREKMKKLVINTLGAVFALSLMSGIASAKGEPEKGKPDPSTLFCTLEFCDYKKDLVRLECVHPNGNTTFFVWSDDDELWYRWCEDIEYE